MKKHISEKSKHEILEDSKKYKKVKFEDLEREPFERKRFLKNLNLHDSCMRFHILSKMVPTVRSNFRNRYKDSKQCPSCATRDNSQPLGSQSHLLVDCPAFEELREGKDLSDDKDLADFFTNIVKHRIDHGQE